MSHWSENVKIKLLTDTQSVKFHGQIIELFCRDEKLVDEIRNDILSLPTLLALEKAVSKIEREAFELYEHHDYEDDYKCQYCHHVSNGNQWGHQKCCIINVLKPLLANLEAVRKDAK